MTKFIKLWNQEKKPLAVITGLGVFGGTSLYGVAELLLRAM